MKGRIGVALAVVASGVAMGGASAAMAPAASFAGGGCHAGYSEGQTEGVGTTVEMRLNCFTPTVLRVEPGAEVTFVNRDVGVSHRVDGVGWSSVDLLLPGDFMTQRFDAPGAYPFACMIHPGMSGVVVVGDGHGGGRVVEVTPVSSRAGSAGSAETAAAQPARPVQASSGAPVGVLLALAAAACLAAFVVGTVRGRQLAAHS